MHTPQSLFKGVHIGKHSFNMTEIGASSQVFAKQAMTSANLRQSDD
jgi:hypothetical protein